MRENAPILDFIRPSSVALFGSMKENWYFGAGVVIKDLIELGYDGRIYPVHPEAPPVCGIAPYRDLKSIPGDIDLAVVITSYRNVPDIMKQCAEKNIHSAVVVSDGFAESGSEGKERQRQLADFAHSSSMRIMGPNTIGVYNRGESFTTIPYEKGYDGISKGGLSIITQTGMFGPQALPLNEYAPGINKIIDLGNMCDIDDTDCLEHLAGDDSTKVISMYIEHTRRPKKFMETAKKTRKPILCLKAGRSPAAAEAMSSHTGSLAGDDALYNAVLRQSHIIRVDEYEDLLECAKAFSLLPLPKGRRLGIITFSGAIGIQCIDAAHFFGLTPGRLSGKSAEALNSAHPSLGGHPVDLGPATASAGSRIFEFYTKSFDTLNADPFIDCIYLNTYVADMLKPEYYTDLLEHMGATLTKPAVSWSYGTSQKMVSEFGRLSDKAGIPSFTTSFKAIRALGHMAGYAGGNFL